MQPSLTFKVGGGFLPEIWYDLKKREKERRLEGSLGETKTWIT
jgi:hypothetical protein